MHSVNYLKLIPAGLSLVGAFLPPILFGLGVDLGQVTALLLIGALIAVPLSIVGHRLCRDTEFQKLTWMSQFLCGLGLLATVSFFIHG